MTLCRSQSLEGHSKISHHPTVRELAAHMGIDDVYIDGRGQSRQASEETLKMVLRELNIPIQSESDIQQAWQQLQATSWTQVLDSVLVHYPEDQTPFIFSLSVPLGDGHLSDVTIECRMTDEQGKMRLTTLKGTNCHPLGNGTIHGRHFVRIRIELPGRLQWGYYDLAVTLHIGSHSVQALCFVIAAPRRCYLPPGSKKYWGIGVQLYGIRSQDNWGIGDFRDLERLMNTAGKKWKASTIGLQPLHSSTPGLSSPYSPSSRLCWNPLYLNLEQIAEYGSSPKVQRIIRTKKFQTALEKCRASQYVMYEDVQRLKMGILEDLYRTFKRQHLRPSTSRGRTFLRFVEQSPAFLGRFCTFQALIEALPGTIWREWPSDYRDPNSSAIERFRRSHADRIQFFYYVQWLCEIQLTKLDQVALKAPIHLGLYHDLPVGIHPDGADAWVFQNQLAKEATMGAPPDGFNLQGQNWGLLAPNPRALREHRYEFFRQTIHQNMKHGGVLRIDHALGLFRMFWVPFGKSGQEGLYVNTHVDEILAVLALESVRHKVLVVGEDLGTVTPAIQHRLQEAGLLSYRLLLFERDNAGDFHPSHQFPPQALVAATTHDLPTLKGYWAGRDIAVKEQANLYPEPEDRIRDLDQRKVDRRHLWESLRRAGFSLPESMPETLTFEIMTMIYQRLARTPSRLLMVQLEDLLGELETPNLPGAPDSLYPSWRVRLHRPLHSWLKDPACTKFFQTIGRERGRRRSEVTSGSYKNHGGPRLLRHDS